MEHTQEQHNERGETPQLSELREAVTEYVKTHGHAPTSALLGRKRMENVSREVFAMNGIEPGPMTYVEYVDVGFGRMNLHTNHYGDKESVTFIAAQAGVDRPGLTAAQLIERLEQFPKHSPVFITTSTCCSCHRAADTVEMQDAEIVIDG